MMRPFLGNSVVLLWKTLYSQSASLHPGISSSSGILLGNTTSSDWVVEEQCALKGSRNTPKACATKTGITLTGFIQVMEFIISFCMAEKA